MQVVHRFSAVKVGTHLCKIDKGCLHHSALKKNGLRNREYRVGNWNPECLLKVFKQQRVQFSQLF